MGRQSIAMMNAAKTAKGKTVAVDYDALSWDEVRALAKSKGVKGRSRDALIQAIKDHE
jgi:hypothetical protein